MTDRGLMVINAADGAIVAAIEDSARTAGLIADRAFRNFGTGQSAHEFADQVNAIWADTGDTDLLTQIMYFPDSVYGRNVTNNAIDYVGRLSYKGTQGFRDYQWSVNTEAGTVLQYSGTRRGPESKPPRVRNSTRTTRTCRNKR